MARHVLLQITVSFAAITCAGAFASSAPASIRRLDGSTITIADADAFARKTLESARVTGEQIAVLDRGRLVCCFTERQACMILLTNSDNGERAFRPILETIMGNTVTPWEWEGYKFGDQ